MMKFHKCVLSSALFILFSLSAYAADGDLDTTFGGGNGWVSTGFALGPALAKSVIQQADGKLLVAGYYGGSLELVRYNTDGTLDTTFDGDGEMILTPVFGSGIAIIKSVTQQADGKLVLAGAFTDYNASNAALFALARYNLDGSLDTTFSGDGKLTTLLGAGGTDFANAVIQQADGKLVAAGYSRNTSVKDELALVRYNPDGSLDTTFSGDGKLTTVMGGSNNLRAYSVIQQADGKLVATGYSTNLLGAFSLVLLRYNSDGSLDTTFDGDGMAVAGANPALSVFPNDKDYDVIRQADGKFVAGGFRKTDGVVDLALVRMNSDGSFDTSFDADGVVVPAISVGHNVRALVQQTDGKLVVAGAGYNGSYSDIAVVRYNSDGSIDTTFGADGKQVTTFAAASGANSVIQQTDGKLVAVGYISGMPTGQEFLVMRYENNQTISKTYNDYNNDNIAGWLWKGDSNGVETHSEIWQLTFPLYSTNWGIPTRSYPPIFADQANWEIVTTGDFNKDGDADILWRNKTTAQWKIWQMQNGIRVAQNDLPDFDLSHSWQVIGAGDTDKDGDDDIILGSDSTGYVMIWEMQDHALVTTHNIGVKPGYIVSRIGDFNKDGDVDLMLSEVGGSTLVVWEIEANAFVTEHTFPNNAAGWDLKCAGDFDHDGDDDILLVNSSTQQEKWFEIQNYARVAQHVGATNVGFVLLGCGDYDGDGDMDMLWQRSADDMNRVVLQQNWGTTKQTVYTNPYGGVNPGAAGYGYVYRGNKN